MWKFILLLLLLCHHAAFGQNSPTGAEANTNSSQPADKQELISKSEISNSNAKQNETKITKTDSAPSLQDTHADDQLPIAEPNGDLDEQLNFKYYWVVLVGSSLSIIALIAFKGLRLRRNRAEIKYGRTSDSEEIEPFSKGSSKWEEDESSENEEDEIFDINFLKNTRLQTHHGDV